MLESNFIQLCVLLILCIASSYAEEQQLLTEPEDLKKLDIKITLFLKDPTKEGWADNLKEIELMVKSIKNMLMVLNGTLPGLTKEWLNKVLEFHKNDKPMFIDTNVVEYELQPIIKVTDEEFTELCKLRIRAQLEWEALCELLKNKQKIQSAISS